MIEGVNQTILGPRLFQTGHLLAISNLASYYTFLPLGTSNSQIWGLFRKCLGLASIVKLTPPKAHMCSSSLVGQRNSIISKVYCKLTCPFYIFCLMNLVINTSEWSIKIFTKYVAGTKRKLKNYFIFSVTVSHVLLFFFFLDDCKSKYIYYCKII